MKKLLLTMFIFALSVFSVVNAQSSRKILKTFEDENYLIEISTELPNKPLSGYNWDECTIYIKISQKSIENTLEYTSLAKDWHIDALTELNMFYTQQNSCVRIQTKPNIEVDIVNQMTISDEN